LFKTVIDVLPWTLVNNFSVVSLRSFPNVILQIIILVEMLEQNKRWVLWRRIREAPIYIKRNSVISRPS